MDTAKKTTAAETTAEVAAVPDVDVDVDAVKAIDGAVPGLEEYVPNTEAEKKLVRKIDAIMIPTLWLMCVFAFMDRNNIGNAKTAGMKTDLDLSNSDYSLIISIFYVGYMVWEVPSNLILSRVSPSKYLPCVMMTWGALVAGMSQVKDAKSLVVCRFFLGFIEACFMPGVIFLMSCWYKKNEIGKRFSIYFTALTVAGALSGILAGAIISGLEGKHGMRGWRWLILLEGVLSMVVGFACMFILLDYPLTTRRFSAAERQLAHVRVLSDRDVRAVKKRLGAWDAVVAALVDPRTWYFMLLYLFDNGCSTISYFVPTLVSELGYKGVMAQWMTVPIWAVATLFLVVVPLHSDWVKSRRWHVTFGFGLAAMSGIIVMCAKKSATRYAFLAFYMSGIYGAFPLTLTWTSDTFPVVEKRGVALAFVNGFGDLAVIYGSYMWPDSDAPGYKPGFIAVVVQCGVAAVLAAMSPYLFKIFPKTATKAERELDVIVGETA